MSSSSYVFLVTLIKNTPDTLKKTSNVLNGKVTKILIDIPSGWAYNAGIRFKFGRSGTLPIESGGDTEQYFTGDDTDINLNPNLKVKQSKLEIFGLNNDAVNDHTCIITIEVEEDE